MCLAPAMDDSHDGSSKGSRDAIDYEFVSAPPAGDPACFLQADAVPIRETLDAEVDAIRAASGLRSISAAMFRRRRALAHLSIAAEYVERRRASACLGLPDDELCRKVRDAMDTRVIGSCAYCGCNFCVVPTVDLDVGRVCGFCGRLFRVHNPVPMVRPAAANAEKRWEGWLPW